MASHCGFPKCTQPAGHGGDFHVLGPVEPDNPSRRYLMPKAEAKARVLATLGPGPYVGVHTVGGNVEGVEDADQVFRKRAGLEDLMRDWEN